MVPPKRDLDLTVVAELAKIASKHDLSEIVIEHEGLHVRIARQREPAPSVSYALPTAPFIGAPVAAPLQPAAIAPPPTRDEATVVKSPMVGTVYLRASPDAKPFVDVGATVKAGEKIMLIEAMKTFNEILAHRSGKVIDVFVADGSPVEYGQALMAIE